MVHAQKCADENSYGARPANGFLYAEATGRTMGQSIYLGGGPVENAVAHWYNELFEPGYDFDHPGPQSGTSHFTALVWYDTTHVGMARSLCGKFIVANYYPPANWEDEELFRQNVLPPYAPFSWRPRNALEQKLKEYFDELARTKSERGESGDTMMVPTETLSRILTEIGESRLADAVRDADADGDGKIHAGEFVHAACTLRVSDESSAAQLDQTMRRTVGFMIVDQNGDNMLDPKELQRYLSIVTGRRWAPEDVVVLLDRFDKDDNGLLDYQELTALHDSGALQPHDNSILLTGWNREAQQLFSEVPAADIISVAREHLEKGLQARVTKTESSLVVKLILEDGNGRKRFHVLKASFGEKDKAYKAARRAPVPRHHVRSSASKDRKKKHR